jgi:hypothetical protein
MSWLRSIARVSAASIWAIACRRSRWRGTAGMMAADEPNRMPSMGGASAFEKIPQIDELAGHVRSPRG